MIFLSNNLYFVKEKSKYMYLILKIWSFSCNVNRRLKGLYSFYRIAKNGYDHLAFFKANIQVDEK